MRRVLPLTIGSVALGLDAYVIAGILPIISGDLHVSVSAAGQMVTVFTLCYALLAPLCAAAAAGRSTRRVLLLALLVFTAGNVLTATAHSLPMLLAGRALAGVGAGLYSPISAAAAASLVPPERRGRALGAIIGGMTTGVVLGVPIGLTLAHHEGWRSTMWLVVGLTVVAAVGIVSLVPADQPITAPSLRERVGVLVDRRVVTTALITLCGSTASIGSYTYLSQLLGHTLHTTGLTPYLWAWGVGGLVGAFTIGQLVDRWKDTRALTTVIMGVLALVLLGLPLIGHDAWLAAAFLFVWGIAGWSSIAPQQHRMIAYRPGDATGAVSLNSSATYLGTALGAGIGGGLLGSGLSPVGVPLVFCCLAALGALANLLFTPASVAEGADATAVRANASAGRP